MTDVKRSGEAVENVMLPVTSFSVTGLVVSQWHIHGGGHKDLCRPDSGIQTAIVRPYDVASFHS